MYVALTVQYCMPVTLNYILIYLSSSVKQALLVVCALSRLTHGGPFYFEIPNYTRTISSGYERQEEQMDDKRESNILWSKGIITLQVYILV